MVYTFSVSTQATTDRLAMDRRRLEMAHMKYALLNVCGWYPSLSVSEMVIRPGQFDEMIVPFSDQYYSCFSAKYARKCQFLLFFSVKRH